jgi:hypothetical protein
MTGPRTSAGELVCQVRGCSEPAQPWGYWTPIGELEVGIYFCRRHERDLVGGTRVPEPEPNGEEAA